MTNLEVINMTENGYNNAHPLLDGSVEKGTKGKILDASIDLFAQKGFDAVTMQEIAEAVGIKKASLYYHFSSKEQILNDILNYPMARLGDMSYHDVTTEQMISSMGLEGFLKFSCDLVLRWMSAPNVEKILRIIFVEMYHNDLVKSYFHRSIEESALVFWEDNFRIMIEGKLVKPYDPKILASEYLAFYTHSWTEYFLLRYGRTEGSYSEEYQEGLNAHTAYIVEYFKA